jgi:hypothetical protein
MELRIVLNDHLDVIYDQKDKIVKVRVDEKEVITCAAFVASI